jgi:hypothetical protein
MNRFRVRFPALIIFAALLLSSAIAQTATIIQANEAAAHVDQYATVEGVVAKVFNPKAATHSQYRRRLPQPDFHRLDSAVLRPKANSLSPN